MENASKALIIAGSILLAIAIIGLGMGVFNKVSDIGSGAGLDSEKIATYNGKFENYIGTKKGSDVINLCKEVKAHNLANVDDTSKNINIKFGSAASKTTAPDAPVTASTVNTVQSNIRSGYTYTVTATYDSESGYICEIGIVRKTGGAAGGEAPGGEEH